MINQRYGQDPRSHAPLESTVVLDLDKEIVQHPEYDPADPDRLYISHGREAYKWADARVESAWLAGLENGEVKRMVLDGTGTNEERQIRRMKQARDAGFYVKALYVRVPVRTAIARAAMRKTGVTPERIETYQRKMASAMEVASSHADEVEIVDVTFDDAPLPGTMHGTEAGSITAVAY